jgi:DNA-binding CsgD family transcriptional regulator
MRMTTGPFVGRERELQIIRRASESARSGHGTLVLVSGEAGIGKTSLIEEAIETITSERVIVLRGSSSDLSADSPYGLWRELFRDSGNSSELPAAPGHWTDDTLDASVQSQGELFRQTIEYIESLVHQAPLVLLLEDLHWSDRSGLDLLHYVVRSIRNLPVLILASFRDDEVSREHPLYSTIPSLVRESHTERIELKRFADDAIATYVDEVYAIDEPDRSQLLTFLQKRSGGNPLFFTEILRSLEFEGDLYTEGSTWRFCLQGINPIPGLIQQLVEARLSTMSSEAIEALEAAAILGQRIPFRLWEHLAQPESVAKATDQGAGVGLINVDYAEQQATFRHALVHQSINDRTSYTKRKLLHLSAAENYERTPNPDPDVVSWHLRQAGDPRAAEWLIRAGEQADRRYASHEAFARYSDALTALKDSAGSKSTRAGLLLKMARSLRFIDPVRGNEYLRAAHKTANACGEQAIAATALFNLGNNLCNLAEVRRGLNYMQQAIARMSEIPDEVIDIKRWTHNAAASRNPLYTMNGSLALMLATLGRFRASVTTAERLFDFDWRERARNGETDEDARGKYLDVDGGYGLGIAFGALGNPEDSKLAFALTDNSLTGLDHRPYRVIVANNELLSYHFPYDTDNLSERRRLTTLIEDHLDLSEGLVGQNNALWGYEHYLVHSGKWDQFRTLIGKNQPSNLFDYWFTSLSARARLAWYEGNSERAREIISELLVNGPQTPPDEQVFFVPAELHRIAAGIAIDEGDFDLARDWMLAHDHWLEWSEAVQGRAEGLLLRARIHLAEGDSEKAQKLAEQARQQAEAPRQPMALIGIHRFLSEMAVSVGDADAAEQHVQSSLLLAESCQLPFERARTLISRAELEIARGNNDHAVSALDESVRISSELGARPTLDRARKLRDPQGASHDHSPHGLSDREREVLALVIEGKTDRQIAGQLYISHRTVMRHVANILRKLDVGSRTAAAAKAVSEELI